MYAHLHLHVHCHKYQCHLGLLIIDAGTILSITRITQKGAFGGGQLVPGFKMQLSAMEEGTARLISPSIRTIPREIFPRNTHEAMIKGCLNSLLGTIIIAYSDIKSPLLLCGGDAPLLFKDLKIRGIEFAHRPNLALEGMIKLSKKSNQVLDL